MSAYECSIVDVEYMGNTVSPVNLGDLLALHPEPDDPSLVAAYHGSTKLGYLSSQKRWLWQVLEQFERPEAVVVGRILDQKEKLVGFEVELSVSTDRGDIAPPPGTAPMAPRVNNVSRSRQPVPRVIVGLVAGVASFLAMVTESL